MKSPKKINMKNKYYGESNEEFASDFAWNDSNDEWHKWIDKAPIISVVSKHWRTDTIIKGSIDDLIQDIRNMLKGEE